MENTSKMDICIQIKYLDMQAPIFSLKDRKISRELISRETNASQAANEIIIVI